MKLWSCFGGARVVTEVGLQASSDCSGLFGVIAGIRQDTNYYIWAVGLLTWLVSPASGRLPEKSTLGVRYWYRCPLGWKCDVC